MTKKILKKSLILLISIFMICNNLSNNSLAEANTTQTTFSQSYILTQNIPKSVDIMTETENIIVGYHKDNSIKVMAKYFISGVSETVAKEILDSSMLSAVQTKHSLQIRVVEKNSEDKITDYISKKYNQYNHLRFNVYLKVLLPDMVEDLSTRSECGNITVDTLKVNVNAASETGNLTVIETQGDIKCSTETGNVQLSSIQGNVDVNTETGNIDAKNMIFQGNCKLYSETGNINCSLQKGKTNISVTKLLSDTGRIKIDVNKLTLAKIHGNNKYSDDHPRDDSESSMKLLVDNKCNISATTIGDIILIK